MDTQRRIILVGRHGDKEVVVTDKKKVKTGRITPESIVSLYQKGKDFSGQANEIDAELGSTVLRISDQNRTRASAQAFLIGALGIPRIDGTFQSPTDEADLDKFDYGVLETTVEPGLSYVHEDFSDKGYRKVGMERYIDNLLQNPDSEEFMGESMVSLNEWRERANPPVRRLINYVVSDESGIVLGVAITHNGPGEVSILDLINTGRSTPIENMGDIGGTLAVEDIAQLTVDRTKGGLYTVTLGYKGMDHKVDLAKYLN